MSSADRILDPDPLGIHDPKDGPDIDFDFADLFDYESSNSVEGL